MYQCFCAGVVYDMTKNYDLTFHVGGVLLVLTGLLFCLLHMPRFKTKTVTSQTDLTAQPETEEKLLKNGSTQNGHISNNV